jgi:hypothetical protein
VLLAILVVVHAFTFAHDVLAVWNALVHKVATERYVKGATMVAAIS